MNRSLRWRHSYTAYKAEELRALRFPSIEEIDRAVALFWEDPELEGLPRKSPDGITFIVPEEAIDILRARGLDFKISRVLSSQDITPEKMIELRQKYGM